MAASPRSRRCNAIRVRGTLRSAMIRGKGQQKVTVEHVHVHAGGQAIVGAITPGGGGKEKSDEQAHAPSEITHERGTPMWSQDPEREAVPVPGGARKAPV